MSECRCPVRLPDWDGRDVDLSGACVHRQPIKTFFSMPIAFDMYQERQRQEVEALELTEPWPGLVLARIGAFGGELLRLLADDSQSLSRRVQHLAGPFQARGLLHNGGIGSIRESYLDLQRALLEHGRMPKELYIAHLTCPVCAERKGGDKILLLRRWVESRRLANRRRPSRH